jgi:hypothetical protein
MRTISITIKGTCPMIQHQMVADVETTKIRTGEKDYSMDWKKAMYFDEKIGCYIPADHIYGTLAKAAVNFVITGRGKKTYKDLVKAAVLVNEEKIPLDKKEPDEIDSRFVVVQRNRINRLRPKFNDGWQAKFSLSILDEQFSTDALKDIIEYAGKFVGIGDFRPRFGRFEVIDFKEK